MGVTVQLVVLTDAMINDAPPMIPEILVIQEKFHDHLGLIDVAVACQLLHAAPGVPRPDLIIVAGAGMQHRGGVQIATRKLAAAIVHLGNQIRQIFSKNAPHIVRKFAAFKPYLGCFHINLRTLRRVQLFCCIISISRILLLFKNLETIYYKYVQHLLFLLRNPTRLLRILPRIGIKQFLYNKKTLSRSHGSAAPG